MGAHTSRHLPVKPGHAACGAAAAGVGGKDVGSKAQQQPDGSGKDAASCGACAVHSKDDDAGSHCGSEAHSGSESSGSSGVRARPCTSPAPGALSQLVFGFVSPVIRHARREGDVSAAQLYFPPSVLVQRVHGRFDECWQRGVAAGHPDIRRAVVANSWRGLLWTGLLYAISLGAQLVGPMLLSRIVSTLSCWAAAGRNAPTCASQQSLYYYVIAISLAPLLQSLVENQMQFQLNVIGLKMRNGLMAALYRKCLRLSNASLQSESVGRVTTLMSNDAQKVQEVMLAIHTLWGAPVLIVVIVGLLYRELGWATFPGLIVVVAYTPISTKVSARLVSLRRSLMQFTDQRVTLMNEIINSIQMIKFMAWSAPFKAAVMAVRDKEAAILRHIIWWQALFVMLLFSGPVMMAVVVFAVYGLTGHTFAPAAAYTSLALFNLLRMPLAFLPIMATAVINALVALTRIGDFLTKPESGLRALREAAAATPPGHVQVEGGSFSWDSSPTAAPSLEGVSFAAAPGSLTMVVGSVGSGKTSLLAGLIGQMECLAGRVAVGGRVAYVAQSAWIVNDSVQENIVMGESFSPSRYRLAVDVAQLLPDMELWPAGDATEIGDRGVTLSGGQKQRVSLARAVYADADVVLLDDPLAAVDPHVGRAIFERCIRGVLRRKTVILVTNALQYLPYADNVLWMDKGRVRAQGRYQQLVEAGLDVTELHLEDHDQDDDAAAASEPGTSASWEAGAADEHAVEPSSSSSSTCGDAPPRRAAGASGSCASLASSAAAAEPLHLEDQEQEQQPHAPQPEQPTVGAASADGGSGERTPSPASSADVTCDMKLLPSGNQQQQPQQQQPQQLQQQQQQQRHAKPAAAPGVKLPASDPASAGDVSAAALRLAEVGPPPPCLSMVRLAAEANRNLTGVEEKEKGSISGAVLRAYIAAAGGTLVALSVVAALALEQGARVVADTWLGFWAGNAFHRDMWFYVAIYACLGVFYSFSTFLRVLWFMSTTVRAAVVLHNRLLTHILRLPKAFFDQTPAGRVLNRFSRDTETMDSVLNQSMVQCCNCFATYIAVLIVISYATKWFALAIPPVTLVYVLVQRYYIPSARELQRLESITRSPIYSKFAETLAGVATIRAYAREVYFTAMSDALMELNAAAFVSQRAAAGWLAVRLDLLGVAVICLTAVLCIGGSITPSLAGLCLVYALDLTRFLKYGTALASKTESDFNSVERVVQYLLPATEAPEETSPEVAAALPADWPATGSIEVDSLVLRYRPSLPPVLRGISFSVCGGEKVGLVGRTGSGKSSLLLALFRMVEAEAGRVMIDGVDIRSIGLTLLRTKMCIIPQEPFLFSGTIRSNLDPFSEYAEPKLWGALDDVGLREPVTALGLGLDAPVVDGGANFSQGQKQLFCLARAILRNSRILMTDEATASVDPESDRVIQAAIRNRFTHATMLTIAHRLNTIIDADRVLVLEAGALIEAGEPHELLQRNAGCFSGMVEQTGASSSTYLRQVARQASLTRAASRSTLSLRQPSERLGQRYTVPGGGGGGVLSRCGSDAGLARFGCQDPMAGALASGGGLVREMSLLQRNAAAGEVPTTGWAGALVRRLQLASSRPQQPAAAGAQPQLAAQQELRLQLQPASEPQQQGQA